MGIFANVAQKQSGGTNPQTPQVSGGIFARKAAEQNAPQPKVENNMFQSLFTNLVGRPAVRTGQAIGSLAVQAFGNDEQKARAIAESQKNVKLPLGLGTVEGQKPLDQGGLKQIAVEGAKTGLDIATLGTGSAVNAGLRGVGEQVLTKTLPSLMKSKVGGFVARQLPGVAANLVEGEGYNTAYNLLNDKPAFENAGVAGALSVGLPPLISGAVKLAPKLIPKSSSIMDRVARLTPSDANKFEKLAGESHGSYLERTGNFGTPHQIVENEATKFANSLKEVDSTLAQLPGVYKNKSLDTVLEDLVKREADIGVPNAESSEILSLFKKNQQQGGLSMKDINEVKRIYERTVKLGYQKERNAIGIARATRLDSALREWQLKTAQSLGFKNLDALNKQTQLSKFMVDKLGKQLTGKSGNEAISLTDWIILSGGDPTAISAFFLKKGLLNKGMQSKFARLISKETPTLPIKAELGGKTGLPAKIPGRDYGTVMQMGAPKTPTTFEPRAGIVNRSSSLPDQKLLPVPTSSAQGVPTALPRSVRETNIGLDEVRNLQTTQAGKLPTESLPKTVNKSLPKTIPQNPQKLSTPKKLSDKGLVTPQALTAGALGLGALSGLSTPSTTFVDNRQASQTTPKKEISPEILSNALMQLESSGGTDKRGADKGEMKWLTGLTEVAIKELKRLKLISNSFDKNNKEDVLDASVKYFELMQKKNPDLSPAEVYTDKYWTQWKRMANPQLARERAIKKFNSLTE